MQWLSKLICNLIGYHHYTIKFSYRNKNDSEVFEFSRLAWTHNKKSILEKRELKKAVSPIFGHPNVKRVLCNGTFDCEIVAYLGRIKV